MVPPPHCNDIHPAATTLWTHGPIMVPEYLNCRLFVFNSLSTTAGYGRQQLLQLRPTWTHRECRVVAEPGSTVHHHKSTGHRLPMSDLHSDADIHDGTLSQHLTTRRTRRPVAANCGFGSGEVRISVSINPPASSTYPQAYSI